MNIEPLHNQYLVEKFVPTNKIGLTLPNNDNLWKVLAVGPGAMSPHGCFIPMSCKVGDIVVTHQNSVLENCIGYKNIYLISDSHILAKYKD